MIGHSARIARRRRQYRLHVDAASTEVGLEILRERQHGCPVAGLSSAAARASAEVRSTLTAVIERDFERLSAGSPGTTATQRRRAAIAAYSAMMGALVLSRIVDDKKLSDEILTTARKAIKVD